MNRVKVLLIIEHSKHAKALKQAYGVLNPNGTFVSGVGTYYILDPIRELAYITMRTGGDANALYARICKARTRNPLIGRIGMVLPSAAMVADLTRLDREFVVFYLTTIERMTDFVVNVPHPNMLSTIYEAEKKKKKKKKRKMVELEEGALILSSAKVQLLTERDVDVVEAADDDEANTCIICFENVITHMAFPCLHYSFCKVCAHTSKTTCPICRQAIDRYITPIKK